MIKQVYPVSMEDVSMQNNAHQKGSRRKTVQPQRRLNFQPTRGSRSGKEIGKGQYQRNDFPVLTHAESKIIGKTVAPAFLSKKTPTLSRIQEFLEGLIGGIIRHAEILSHRIKLVLRDATVELGVSHFQALARAAR